MNSNASPVAASTAYSAGVGVDDQAADLIQTSVWKKVLIGAVVTPVCVGGLTRKFMVRNADKQYDFDPIAIGLLLVLSSVVGGLLGALLAWKDRVEYRRANNLPISFPSKLLFGYGILSLVLVWVPIAILGTLLVLVLTL
ncbi:hypothetical protein [Rhodopirellula sp. P2]|uniref:hypothetical protein n=1 Tax=Rhodopirellula sp. P2 TaxID=2127060 RepID=UPI0023674A56|nr:hypothetical protein [Rhodopirellula sp. P2]WDQ16317.1 hypothetical protein PSR62_22215 [Rhodopirellula sp. P2]